MANGIELTEEEKRRRKNLAFDLGIKEESVDPRAVTSDPLQRAMLQKDVDTAVKRSEERKVKKTKTDDFEDPLTLARRRKLAGLDVAEEAVREEAREARIGEETGLRKAQQSFGEFLAQRGLGDSGLAGAGDIQLRLGTQQAISDIGRQERQALADIGTQRAQADIDFELGKQQLRQQQEAQAFERAEADRIRAAEQQNKIELTQIDAAIRQARDTQNFAQEQQLINLRSQKEQESIRLRDALSGTATTEGVSTDTLKSFKTGTDRLVERIDPFGTMPAEQYNAQLEAIVEQQVAAMVQRGATRQQVEDFIASYGLQTTTGAPTQTGVATGQVR